MVDTIRLQHGSNGHKWRFGAELAALIAERHLMSLHAPVVRVAGWDAPYPPFTSLEGLYRQLQWSVALVGLLFTGLALRFARSIVRPIRALTQAAGALKEGHYDGTGVEVKRRDELGQLGRTFNVMIDVLRQRERERRREP